MPNLFTRGTDGSDADSGLTWALAKATLAGAAAIDAAGDRVYVSQAHAQSSASGAHVWAGTNSNPVWVIGANDAAEPPTTPSTAPTITITGTTFTWQGGVYTEGLNFVFTSASSFAIAFNDSTGFKQSFRNCSFFYDGAGGGTSLSFGSATLGATNSTDLINCTFRFGATGNRFGAAREVNIRGGAWAAGGVAPTGIFSLASGFRPAMLTVEGFDFSALPAATNLVQVINEGGARAIFRNCRLPASWSGSLVAAGQMTLGSVVEMHNCDSGDTTYRMWVERFEGSVRSETTVVRTGGASDGTTPQSWRMVSSANVAYPNLDLTSPEIALLYVTPGTPVTLSVEIVTDNVTLNDNQCWIDVQYLGTSGFPRSLFATDAPANVLTTAVAQTTSTETWTTTGLTTPVRQRLSVTFTPQEAGFMHVKVKLARPSTTVFVDHKVARS